MTISEVKKEMKALEKGKKTPKKCYLCKRPEGDKSILLTPNEKEPYVYAKITLIQVQRRATKDWMFDYLLCWECALLVGLGSKGPLLQHEHTRTKGWKIPGPCQQVRLRIFTHEAGGSLGLGRLYGDRKREEGMVLFFTRN